MKRFSISGLLPVLTVTILLCETAALQACLFNWWGAYRPTYSSYYAPTYGVSYGGTYTASYVPSYSTYYAPSYYSASYVPATTYYAAPATSSCATCCPTGSCGLQTSYYASSTCCSPCASCVSCGNNCCSDCCDGNCNLASSSSSSSNSGNPTPVTPRADGAGSQGRTPTFIEEEDRGTGYDNQSQPARGTGDGFSPRNPDVVPDPLDQGLGTSSAARETLRFEIPESVINRRQPAPTHPEDAKKPALRVNDTNEYPVLNLDEKITSRSLPQRTRLIERRSWEQPMIAKNVSRQVPVENLGWVPVPAPTQLVQK